MGRRWPQKPAPARSLRRRYCLQKMIHRSETGTWRTRLKFDVDGARMDVFEPGVYEAERDRQFRLIGATRSSRSQLMYFYHRQGTAKPLVLYRLQVSCEEVKALEE